jgi:hypothetical protein
MPPLLLTHGIVVDDEDGLATPNIIGCVDAQFR